MDIYIQQNRVKMIYQNRLNVLPKIFFFGMRPKSLVVKMRLSFKTEDRNLEPLSMGKS